MVAPKRQLVNEIILTEITVTKLQNAWSSMRPGKQRDTICRLSLFAERTLWRLKAQAGNPIAQQFFTLLAQAEKAAENE